MGAYLSSVLSHPATLHNTRKVSDILQARYALAHGETLVKSVCFADCNPSTILTGEGSNLNTLDKSQDVAIAIFRVEEFNLAVISF